MSIDTNNSASTRTVVNWDDAPEGATHCLIKDSGTAWFRFKDDNSFPNTWKDGEWKNVRLPTRELTPKPKQPKQLTQAVFNGLSSEYRWAYLDKDGDPVIFCDLEAEHDARFPDHKPDCYYDGLEWATWMDNVLWRTESITDVARSIEAARVEERDAVNNPEHYKTGGIECIDAMQAMLSDEEFIGYLRGNIFKYQWRYKHKNGVEDLRKADWYAQRLVELEAENAART